MAPRQPTSPLGGTGDANPGFTANQTNVYGSTSSGAWLVSIPVTLDLNASGGHRAVKIAATNINGTSTAGIVYARCGRSIRIVAEQSSSNTRWAREMATSTIRFPAMLPAA